jgi:hypothetical protein
MNIIGFYAINRTIANSEGEVIQSPPYLKWLLKHPEDTFQVFYECCINDLLSIIGIQGQSKRELLTTTKLTLPHYKYRYIPNKFFSIKRNSHHLSYFCNMSQYTPNFDVSNLKALDNETEVDYCLRLASEAKCLGLELCKALNDIGIQPGSLTSLYRIYQNAKLSNPQLNIDYEWLSKYIGDRLTVKVSHAH